MQEITLEELYEVIWQVNTQSEGRRLEAKESVQLLLTDLNKLGYKIVKQ